jgi:hypothetical protein
MIARKLALATAAVALMSTPAWATASNDGTGHPPPGTHGKAGQHGASHKCKPHKVGYAAAGVLVSQTLTKDDGANTYSGDVTVDVKHTNHHAAGDKGKTVTYTVSHAHVTFGLADVNGDGSAGLDDLQPNARVKVIGKITTIARKCDQTGFTPEITIRRVVFHAPADASPNP